MRQTIRAIASTAIFCAAIGSASAQAIGLLSPVPPGSSGSYSIRTLFKGTATPSPNSFVYCNPTFYQYTGGHSHNEFGHPLPVFDRSFGQSDDNAWYTFNVTWPNVSAIYAFLCSTDGGTSISQVPVQLNRPMAPFICDPAICTGPSPDVRHIGDFAYLRREIVAQAQSAVFNLKESHLDAAIHVYRIGLQEGGIFDSFPEPPYWRVPLFDGHEQGDSFDMTVTNLPTEVVSSYMREAGCRGGPNGTFEGVTSYHFACSGVFLIFNPPLH